MPRTMERSEVTALLRVLTDSLAQGVLVLDERGRLLHANAAAHRRLGLGTRLRPGASVDAVLRGRFELSRSRVQRLFAGESVQVGPETGRLELRRVVLPGAGGRWTAIVLEDHHTPVTASLGAPIAPSHDALWAAIVHAVDCGHDVGLPVAVFTASVDPPVEVGRLCQALRDQARPGEIVGFLDVERIGVSVPERERGDPAPILAAIVSPGCAGVVAAERRRELSSQLRTAGWPTRVGAAALRLDWDQGGRWLADDRAVALVRQAIDSAGRRTEHTRGDSERAQRRLRESARPGSERAA